MPRWQDRYEQVHHAIMGVPGRLDEGKIRQAAMGAGLDLAQAERDLNGRDAQVNRAAPFQRRSAVRQGSLTDVVGPPNSGAGFGFRQVMNRDRKREDAMTSQTPPVPQPVPGIAALQRAVALNGFAVAPASEMARLLAAGGLEDWEGFRRSWADLGLDTWMADGGRYRRRRYACFSVSRSGIRRKPHQPHYQSRDHNPLNGGVDRWFEPMRDEVAAHAALQAILRTCLELFDPLTPELVRPPDWHAEVHQFRIEARAEEPGRPTPEGMHRDGVDWIFVLLIERLNIVQGTTTILDTTGHPLGRFTLMMPMDAALVDDARILHGVTPIVPNDPSRAAHRDVLVVTLCRPT